MIDSIIYIENVSLASFKGPNNNQTFGLWGLFWMLPKNLLPCRCASTLRVDRRTVWESTDGLMARRHQLSHLSGAAVMGPMNGMALVRAMSFGAKIAALHLAICISILKHQTNHVKLDEIRTKSTSKFTHIADLLRLCNFHFTGLSSVHQALMLDWNTKLWGFAALLFQQQSWFKPFQSPKKKLCDWKATRPHQLQVGSFLRLGNPTRKLFFFPSFNPRIFLLEVFRQLEA